MPPELIKDNLAPQKNINQETSENLKKSLKSRIKESEEKTSDFSKEREFLYKALFDLKKELSDLKQISI